MQTLDTPGQMHFFCVYLKWKSINKNPASHYWKKKLLKTVVDVNAKLLDFYFINFKSLNNCGKLSIMTVIRKPFLQAQHKNSQKSKEGKTKSIQLTIYDLGPMAATDLGNTARVDKYEELF